MNFIEAWKEANKIGAKEIKCDGCYDEQIIKVTNDAGDLATKLYNDVYCDNVDSDEWEVVPNVVRKVLVLENVQWYDLKIFPFKGVYDHKLTGPVFGFFNSKIWNKADMRITIEYNEEVKTK